MMKGLLKAIGYFLLYLLMTLVIQVLLSIGLMAIAAVQGLRDEKLIVEFANNNILGMTVVSGILTILILFLIFKFRKKDVKKEWKLNPFKMKDVLEAAIVSFSASFVFSMFTYNNPAENSIMISKSVEYYSNIAPILGIALMMANLLCIAPIAEEIALRGIVYTRAEQAANSFWAIVLSSVLFGLMHIGAGGAVLAVGAMIMAIVFGCVYYKCNSLWVCIIAHIAANLPDFILLHHPNIPQNLHVGLTILFICIFGVGMYFLMIKKNQ